MFYRLFIPLILPKHLGKAIYLDGDIIVTLDIIELWRIDPGNKPLGVVTEPPLSLRGVIKDEDYFNSGVLLMNLDVLRGEEETLTAGMKFLSENPQHAKWLDQDLLNYCFAARSVKLPQKFNFHSLNNAWIRNNETVGRKIYHYRGGRAALGIEIADKFNRLWMKYFMRTPWFDVESIGRLYAGVQQLHVGLKQSMINLSAAMSGKSRAFFIAPQNLDAMRKIFSIRDDEEIITVENQTSLQKLITAMNASRGKKIFFIVLPQFPFQFLTQFGFVPGRDFFNGMDFLSEAHGVPFNSYPLIEAM